MCGALVRLSQHVKPTNLDLDMGKYSSYTDNGRETAHSRLLQFSVFFLDDTGKLLDPSELHTLLQGHILKLKQRKVLNGHQDSVAEHSDSV